MLLPIVLKINSPFQKLSIFSGPPGAGKSTSAQLMGRHHGHVYYEADCMFSFANPFIDLSVENPSMAQMMQKPLKVFLRTNYLVVYLVVSVQKNSNHICMLYVHMLYPYMDQ